MCISHMHVNYTVIWWNMIRYKMWKVNVESLFRNLAQADYSTRDEFIDRYIVVYVRICTEQKFGVWEADFESIWGLGIRLASFEVDLSISSYICSSGDADRFPHTNVRLKVIIGDKRYRWVHYFLCRIWAQSAVVSTWAIGVLFCI